MEIYQVVNVFLSYYLVGTLVSTSIFRGGDKGIQVRGIYLQLLIISVSLDIQL